jgi:hypothetical protein
MASVTSTTTTTHIPTTSEEKRTGGNTSSTSSTPTTVVTSGTWERLSPDALRTVFAFSADVRTLFCVYNVCRYV